jgi:hypothetical protein
MSSDFLLASEIFLSEQTLPHDTMTGSDEVNKYGTRLCILLQRAYDYIHMNAARHLHETSILRRRKGQTIETTHPCTYVSQFTANPQKYETSRSAGALRCFPRRLRFAPRAHLEWLQHCRSLLNFRAKPVYSSCSVGS